MPVLTHVDPTDTHFDFDLSIDNLVSVFDQTISNFAKKCGLSQQTIDRLDELFKQKDDEGNKDL